MGVPLSRKLDKPETTQAGDVSEDSGFLARYGTDALQEGGDHGCGHGQEENDQEGGPVTSRPVENRPGQVGRKSSDHHPEGGRDTDQFPEGANAEKIRQHPDPACDPDPVEQAVGEGKNGKHPKVVEEPEPQHGHSHSQAGNRQQPMPARPRGKEPCEQSTGDGTPSHETEGRGGCGRRNPLVDGMGNQVHRDGLENEHAGGEDEHGRGKRPGSQGMESPRRRRLRGTRPVVAASANSHGFRRAGPDDEGAAHNDDEKQEPDGKESRSPSQAPDQVIDERGEYQGTHPHARDDDAQGHTGTALPVEPSLNRRVGNGPGCAASQPYDQEKKAEMMNGRGQAAEGQARADEQGADKEHRLGIVPVRGLAACDHGHGISQEKGREDGRHGRPAPSEFLFEGLEKNSERPEGFTQGQGETEAGGNDQPPVRMGDLIRGSGQGHQRDG